MAVSGLIGFDSAVFVLFGQNIGTCITAVLASIGTNRSARRTTIIHLMFNIIGTIIFTTLCLTLPITDWIGAITPNNPAAQIANMHTTFNIVTTCLLLPFGTYLAKLAEKILPELEEEKQESVIVALNKEFHKGNAKLGFSAVHMDVLRQEIERMIVLAQDNVKLCYQAVLDSDLGLLKKAEETEENIDTLNKEISQYISKILVNNRSDENIAAIEEYFLITGNAERIGDHALNIGGYAEVINKKNIVFSDAARKELKNMQKITHDAIDYVLHKEEDTTKWLSRIAAMEQKIDDMRSTYREEHLQRMRDGKCSEEACVLYSELLTDFERVGDHVLNIGQSYAKIYSNIS